MPDETRLCREWIEIREETSGPRVVLRPAAGPIPPSRMARRGVEFYLTGRADALEPGPTDAMHRPAHGRWRLDGDVLHLELAGWAGDYEVQELGDDLMVLKRC